MDDLSLLFQDPNNLEIRQQDALDMLRSLPDQSAQMVLTDPPYGISYQSNRSKHGPSAAIESDWNFQFGPFLQETQRILQDGGVAYVFTRWDVFPLWMKSVNGERGLAAKNLIVWVKDNHTAGDLRGNFGAKWEGIMMLVKGRHLLRGHRHPNVWTFPRVPRKSMIHPAEKPVPLLMRLIESSSDEGGLVVDPFCGSGSTAEAALACGRQALIGDVDERWLFECQRRLGVQYTRPLSPPPPMDVSVLEGVNPDDIAALVADLRSRSKSP